MNDILIEIVTLMTSGIAEFGKGFGAGLMQLAQAIFLTGAGTDGDPYKLSIMGGLIIIFAGISLSIGISRWFMNFITSLGN